MSAEQVNEQRRLAADQAEQLRTIKRVVSVPAEPRFGFVRRNGEGFLAGFLAGRGLRHIWRLWH